MLNVTSWEDIRQATGIQGMAGVTDRLFLERILNAKLEMHCCIVNIHSWYMLKKEVKTISEIECKCYRER